MPTLAEQLKNTSNFADANDRLFEGAKVRSDDRSRICLSLFDQVFEHHRAIAKLVELRLVGSAFALLRGCYEGFLRGTWLLHCATDDQVQRFITKDDIPKRDVLVAAIEEKQEAFKNGTLSKIVGGKVWNAMCSYAHGGALQALRRIQEGVIAPAYSDDEQKEVLRSADFFMLLSAVEAAGLTDRADRFGEILASLQASIEAMVAAHEAPPTDNCSTQR
jgi:hypothetical protein